ncbi:MAG: hypothetical protein EXQ50_03990 [Acidobacteria bacterium]|nr:hypothetical protein [Acidobacteriota bacterium]MSO61241.1 hypothetical protein [Acidobacteriota bacterium]
MRLTVHRSLPVAAAFLLASTVLAGCEVNLNTEGLSARETKTFKVAGLPEIDLDTFDGAIEIHSWDKPEVEVEIEKRAMDQSLIDQIKVEATQQGDKIVLKVTGPSRTDFGGVTIGVHISPTARLRVVVPRASNIVARSGDGSIRLDKVSGKLDLETDDGSIGFEGKPSFLRLKTGDGSVRSSHPMLDDERDERRSGEGGDDRRERRRVMRTKMGDGGKTLRVRTGDGTIRIDR